MRDGFIGRVEVGGKEYIAYSESETEDQIKERIARQQLAAAKVLEVLVNIAVEHEVSPHSVVTELDHLTKEVN